MIEKPRTSEKIAAKTMSHVTTSEGVIAPSVVAARFDQSNTGVQPRGGPFAASAGTVE